MSILPILSKRDIERIEQKELVINSRDEPNGGWELSTHKDPNTRQRSAAANNGGSSSTKHPGQLNLSKPFRTIASLELPLRFKENGLIAEKNARTAFKFVLPPSAQTGRWSAAMGGSTIVRGPIGCASGDVHIAYHPSIRAQIFGGLAVGDHSHVSIGGSASSWDKSKHGSLSLNVSPKGQLSSSLSTRYTKSKLYCVNANVSTNLALRTSLGLSVSTLTSHKIYFGLGWRSARRSLLPTFQFRLQPRLSKHRRATLSCGTTATGRWQFGADIVQSFQSKITSLGIGISHFKQRLLWTFTWHRGDVSIRVPVLITKTTGTLLIYAQMAMLSVLSAAIQELLTKILKLQNDNDESNTAGLNVRSELSLLNQNKIRADAEQQRQLMSRQAKNRVRLEEEMRGLVIKHAVYQVHGGDSWDVTVQLQFWTQNSSLELPASSKEHLLGFYNVAASSSNGKPSSDKNQSNSSAWENWWSQFWNPQDASGVIESAPEPTLTVRYEYSGDTYEITVQDSEPLFLPSSMAVRVK